MVIKFPARFIASGFVVICIVLCISSCKRSKEQVDISQIPVTIEASRFERDLFNPDYDSPGDLKELRQKYGDFFDLFAYRITVLGTPDTMETLRRFSAFVSDSNFRAIYIDCERLFADFSEENRKLTEAFRYYSVYFPGKVVPRVITLITGFAFPVVADSLNLGIGLDMYLGSDHRMYDMLEPPIPNYLRRRMEPEYVVSDAVKGWLQSDYAVDETEVNMLGMMINQGKILYGLRQLMPGMHDTLLTGYSAAELKWCEENEGRIWSFFVDNNLLFSRDPQQLAKYTGEGPTTSGFPAESPGNLGQYLGLKIVESYMKDRKMKDLITLMETPDDKLFNESKYKPENK